jgi:uncharacterized membrane protein YedE/YeeE
MDQLISLVGAIALLLLALDGIAYMFGRRNFPAIRLAVRLIRRLIGGAIVGIGRAVRGGGGGQRR